MSIGCACHAMVDSDEAHLSVGCHCPEQQRYWWPLVFFRSRMYMSPLMNCPNSWPSRSKILGCDEPVTTRNASPVIKDIKGVSKRQTVSLLNSFHSGFLSVTPCFIISCSSSNTCLPPPHIRMAP